MKKTNLLAFTFAALFLTSSLLVLAPTPVRATNGIVIGFDYYHTQVGNQTIYRAYGLPGPSYEVTDRQHLFGNLTKQGYAIDLINTTLDASGALSNVNVLVLGKITDPPMNFSQAEVQAIVNWFKTGNKLLMMSGNSDYTSNDTEHTAFMASIPNGILKAVGSQLRLEAGEVTDQPGVGASGAGFRLYASSSNNGVNTQGWANNITTGTQKVRFHGTTNIVGWQNSAYVPFSSLTGDTVTWLYRTSPQGTLQAFGADKPYTTTGAGQWVLAAAEKLPEGSTYSKVIVAGAAFYGNYVINADTEFSYNISFQGLQFVLNAVKWGTTSESVPVQGFLGLPTIDWIAIVVVVVIVIVAVAFVMMRRKPAAQPAAPAAQSQTSPK
jgi:hypothetical protein